MTFTPLETLLLAAVFSALVGLALRMRSVSPRECRAHRLTMQSEQKSLQMTLERMEDDMARSSSIQFRMLRGIIAHMDIPPKEKEKLLNMEPGD